MDVEQEAVSIQLLAMLRSLDSKISEVNERTIRIEAQEFGKQFTELKAEVKHEREERVKLQLVLERIQTKIAPVVIGVSMILSSGVSMAATKLFG